MMKRFTYLFLVLTFLLPDILLAQGTSVTGKVTDSRGDALAGVNILVKGTSTGTTTGDNGSYSISVPSADAVLVFSMVGYKKMEIRPAGRTQLNVTLDEGVELGEVFVLGTRSGKRTVVETPVPVDVFEFESLAASGGHFDVNQIMQFAAPSFNSNRQSGADGADHVDPATLRGLGPDQTLVLLNGWRRHQSSLINIFGTRGRGNTGTDLNAIPAFAIDRVEILRDGASAQYGSDAIAGVVNVHLKSSVNKFTGSIGSGARQSKFRTDRDYDGEEFSMSGNYGFAIGEEGFFNFTGDYLRKGKTNRPADPAKYDIYRKEFGDASLDNYAIFFNHKMTAGSNAVFYAFGGLNHRESDAFAWTRDPDSDRNVPAIYPNGFNPHIQSTIRDYSVSGGFNTQLHDWKMDFNNTIGVNRFHYIIDGTLNASLLEKSPTRFDAGGFSLMQNSASANASKFFKDVAHGLNVAAGLEWRVENYTIFAGDEGSWKNYGVIDTVINGRVVQYDALGRPGGSQGFPGFRPENELDEFRSNLGAYADVELDVNAAWMLGAALRYEHYADFGNTINAKFATRYMINNQIALRGSFSTGFRAPSLAQIYFNSTFTDFVSGTPVDKLIAKNNSPITRALGIPALKQETATNLSLGFTANYGNFVATIDGYMVEIKDRIVLTGAFEDTDPDIGADLQRIGVGAAQFFTNALDTKTSGLDVILSYKHPMGDNTLGLSLAGNFNDMELGDVKTTPRLASKKDIYFGKREQYFLLASAPPVKMTFGADYSMDKFSASLKAIYFGKVTLIDWLDTEDIYNAKMSMDLSLSYKLSKNLTLTAGAVNLLDEYPDVQADTETESGGLWDAVQMGFSGRFYFTRLSINF